jgi:hypothetical protein
MTSERPTLLQNEPLPLKDEPKGSRIVSKAYYSPQALEYYYNFLNSAKGQLAKNDTF